MPSLSSQRALRSPDLPAPAGRSHRAGGAVIPITRRRAAARLASRNRLVEAHLHLVAPIANAIQRGLPPCFDVDDLTSAGHIGLLRAADRYEPDEHAGRRLNRSPASGSAERFSIPSAAKPTAKRHTQLWKMKAAAHRPATSRKRSNNSANARAWRPRWPRCPTRCVA